MNYDHPPKHQAHTQETGKNTGAEETDNMREYAHPSETRISPWLDTPQGTPGVLMFGEGEETEHLIWWLRWTDHRFAQWGR